MNNKLPVISIPETDLRPSAICFGTAELGSRQEDSSARLYEIYREAGGNCFDTAHCYAFWRDQAGTSERTLGKLVSEHGDRNNVIICSKGCHSTGDDRYPRPAAYMTPELLEADLLESLDRLGMEKIDLYYLHRDDPLVPVDEILDVLHRHEAAGLIGAFAASNWRPERLEQAAAYSRHRGYRGFVASQILYNLGHLHGGLPAGLCFMDDAQATWYAQKQMPVFAYSPTANGYFAGSEASAGAYVNSTSSSRRGRVVEIAGKHGATPNQIALAYLLSQPFPVVPILGTLDEGHLRDALGSASYRLTPEEITYLKNG